MRQIYEQYRTPCYVIHESRFSSNLRDIKEHFEKYWTNDVICSYSCKTNNNENMLMLAKRFGMYAEVVSSKEYHLVKKAGYEDKKIIFNGPYKGEAVYEACHMGAIVNIDNLQELEELSAGFFDRYHMFPEKLGLRVNFDLEACVPGQTSTGAKDGRFGICYENGDVEKALNYLKEKEIRLDGLHIHYTTKTRSLEVYSEISKMILKLITEYDLELSYIDIGGGFWGGRRIEGKPTMEEYAKTISDILNTGLSSKLILEPGSALCSTAVEYWSKVIAVKDIRDSRFITLDGSSLHINPFQFERDAQYILDDVKEYQSETVEKKQILCGATCLEKDRFACVDSSVSLEKGDIIKFVNVGAYTMSFVSDFILEKPEVYVAD